MGTRYCLCVHRSRLTVFSQLVYYYRKLRFIELSDFSKNHVEEPCWSSGRAGSGSQAHTPAAGVAPTGLCAHFVDGEKEA